MKPCQKPKPNKIQYRQLSVAMVLRRAEKVYGCACSSETDEIPGAAAG